MVLGGWGLNMDIKLPENPNVYVILLGVLCFITLLIKPSIFGKFDILFEIILVIATLFFLFVGYSGLEKTQRLKDRKIIENTKLLKKKQQEQDLRNEKLIEELSQKESIFPNVFDAAKRERIRKRIKK